MEVLHLIQNLFQQINNKYRMKFWYPFIIIIIHSFITQCSSQKRSVIVYNMSKHTIDSIEIPREYRSQISIQPQNSRKFTYNPKAMTNDEGTSLIYVYTNKIRLRSYVGSHFMFYYYPEQDTLYVYDHGISYKPIPPIKPEKFHVFLDTEHIDSLSLIHI